MKIISYELKVIFSNKSLALEIVTCTLNKPGYKVRLVQLKTEIHSNTQNLSLTSSHMRIISHEEVFK